LEGSKAASPVLVRKTPAWAYEAAGATLCVVRLKTDS